MITLGIDIGGTGIKGALVDAESGQLITGRLRIPTPKPATPGAVTDVVADIAKNFRHTGPTGITFPGVVKQGRTLSAANLDPQWVGTDAAKVLSLATGDSVVVVNDADAAGLAEGRFGAARDARGLVVLITLGTGIGSALLYNGTLIPNSEFGHLKIRGKDAELRASERIREEKDLSWKKWSGQVAVFLRELERLLSPDLFVIGGGISKKADKSLPHLASRVSVPIVPASMKNEAGIVGAAWLASQTRCPE